VLILDWVSSPLEGTDGDSNGNASYQPKTRSLHSQNQQQYLSVADVQQSRSPVPVIILVPGLCNHSHEHYLRHFSRCCKKRGYRAVIFHPRGTDQLTTPKLFTYGGTSELRQTIEHIRAKLPCAALIGVGFSMGGNILMRLVGQDSEFARAHLACAISISQGYDGLQGIKYLQTTMFHNILIRKLLKLFARHADVFRRNSNINVDHVLNSVSDIEEFDQLVTCTTYGFKDPETYYKDNSCIHHLHKVSIPSLLLNALDDPLVPPSLIPSHIPLQNEHVILATTQYGGHLGWAQGFLLPFRTHWHELVTLQFIDAVLTEKTE